MAFAESSFSSGSLLLSLPCNARHDPSQQTPQRRRTAPSSSASQGLAKAVAEAYHKIVLEAYHKISPPRFQQVLEQFRKKCTTGTAEASSLTSLHLKKKISPTCPGRLQNASQENLGGIRVIVDVLWKLFTRRHAIQVPPSIL